MTFNVTFETVEKRNSFASKIGHASHDSASIDIDANLFTYAMRDVDAEVSQDGSPINLIVQTSDLPVCPEHTVVSSDGLYSVVETTDPIGFYHACSGNIDCVDAQIKLLSALSGTTVTTPNDWARRRLSNRFRPFKEFATFNIKTTNKPVVFVVDSGISSHPELNGVEIVNFGKLSFCDSYSDTDGHGTGVASCISGNTIGITQNVSLYNYKVFSGSTKPTILELGTVLDEIKEFKQNNPTKNVTINASWIAPYSPYLRNKFLQAIEAGCVVICAAGNNADDVSNYTPAGMPEVITVGAVDDDDIIAGFTSTSIADAEISSAYGQSLDVFAPGVDVDVASISGNYVRASGTSISAPFVTAAAALIQSISTSPPSNAQVLNLISKTSLKGSILFNRENFSSKQNKIVQIINGDMSSGAQQYIGTLSGSNQKLEVKSSFIGFNNVTTLVGEDIIYTAQWLDDAQKQKYMEFFQLDAETGDIIVNIPAVLPNDDFEKIYLTISKNTNYSTEEANIFFYITDAEEVPTSIVEDLDSSEYYDISNLTADTTNINVKQ
jgi:subtilisin family serine protease